MKKSKTMFVVLIAFFLMSTGMYGAAGEPAGTSLASQPAISVSPTSKDYGNLAAGRSKSATFRMYNEGTSSLTLGAISIEGTDGGEFAIKSDGCSGKTIKPSRTCSLAVAFAPTSSGSRSAQIMIPSNDPDTPTLTVNITGTSVPILSVSPTSKNYGSLAAGKTKSATFRLSNKGAASLTLGAISIDGTDSGEFAIKSDGCSGKSLSASKSCSLVVAFVPTAAGSKSAEIQIPSDDPTTSTLSVGLTGTATGGSTTCTVYSQSGGSVSKTNQTYCSTSIDESAVKVTNSGTLNLSKSTITKSGNTSNGDNSSFYGLNAGVLVNGGSTLTFSNSTVTTTGIGANGVFAYGSGASIILEDVAITCTAQLGHAVMTSGGGSLSITNVNMSTAGSNSGAIATDRGGGTITVSGGTVVTSGADSPGIYSTGAITVTGAAISASGSESAVIEGSNSIHLTQTTLTSSKAGKWGVLMYQSMSGDAEGTEGTFTMTGGSLSNTASTGPLFYVTNSTGIITLSDVDVVAASGMLIKAAAGNWGTSGSNGGTVFLTAHSQVLTGNICADSISSVTATLQNNSYLTGKINEANTAKTVSLVLDSTSTWYVTGNSYLTCLTDGDGISGATVTNILGNGYTVYYDKTVCTTLAGQTYTLNGGGYLTPK